MTALERDVLAALKSRQVGIRTQALTVFGQHGSAANIDAIAGLCDHEDPRICVTAIQVIGAIAARPSATAKCREILLRQLYGGRDRNRRAALACIGLLRGEDLGDIVAMLSTNSIGLRAIASQILSRANYQMHEDDVSMVLEDSVGSHFEAYVGDVMARASERDRPQLQAYLQSGRPYVRSMAAEGIIRLDAIAGGAPGDFRTARQKRRRQVQEKQAEAGRELAGLEWIEVERSEVMAAVRVSRLVLFGELHGDDDRLRMTQVDVLKEMVKAAPGHVVLGYEPSAYEAQKAVIEVARSMSVPVVSMEDGWEELLAEHKVAERDDQVAHIINTYLGEDEQCRIMVIRGETHVLPSGYLASKLAYDPLTLLSVEFPTFDVIGDRPLAGRSYQLGGTGRIYYVGVENSLDGLDALRKWVKTR